MESENNIWNNNNVNIFINKFIGSTPNFSSQKKSMHWNCKPIVKFSNIKESIFPIFKYFHLLDILTSLRQWEKRKKEPGWEISSIVKGWILNFFPISLICFSVAPSILSQTTFPFFSMAGISHCNILSIEYCLESPLIFLAIFRTRYKMNKKEDINGKNTADESLWGEGTGLWISILGRGANWSMIISSVVANLLVVSSESFEIFF